MTVDHEHVVLGQGRVALLGSDLGFHAALDGIILELVGEVLGVGGDIHDRDDVDLVLTQEAALDQGLKHEPADAAETINRYFHRILLLGLSGTAGLPGSFKR